MPKTYKRRKAPAKGSTGQSRASSTHKVSAAPVSNAKANGTNTTLANRRFLSPRVAGPQSLIFPAMIASGCWLMAYTLVFLTNDPNRYLIGGLAVLMALLWTFSFGVRVRKLLIQRRSG
ncbi:MAG TPA: hypothetical protein VEL49_00740 [Ktedonobacteraceae bacterium]|nr:hypothetical protein [Ktedonobacteraceae bacterium]